MKLKKLLIGFAILSVLACSTVTNMVLPPTATPQPPTATVTLTAPPTPTETATPVVPAYIPPECAAQPIVTVSPDVIQPTQEVTANEEITKEEQLQILKEVGNVVDDVYVYPDFNGKDWKEIKARYKSIVEAGLETEKFYQAMESMIEELGDDHSFFLSPLDVKEAEAELRGENNFVGIGIYSTADLDHGRLVVISTFSDSSAEHAGIKSHDSILRVDGQPVLNGSDNLLHGPECSAVVVTVQSPGQAPRDILMVRHKMSANLQIDARLVPTTDGSKIGYIFIPTFFDETIPAQIETALEGFGQLDGLILDLRMNGGGSSTVTDPIMSFFTSGNLGRFVGRTDSRSLNIDPYPVDNSQTVPMVVMVGQETVSYGEIFAGIMRDSRHAKITGETSLGNVEVLHGFNFEDGSQLWIAAEKFFPAHSKANWEETGIVPDMQADAPWDSFTFDDDPSIAAALNLLGRK